MTDQLTPYRPAPVTLRGGADPDAVLELARMVAHATGTKVPNALLRIALAESVGLSLGQAMSDIHDVEGRPCLSATAQLAVARRAGVRTRWLRCDAEVAEIQMLIPGDDAPVTHRYTIDDAQRAGLTGRKNWRAYPDAMLRARCITAAIRAHCPEVLGGSVYDPDEIEGISAPAPRRHPEAITIDQQEPPQQEPPAREQPPQEQPAPPAKSARPWQEIAASVLPAARVALLGDPSGWDRDQLQAEAKALRGGRWRDACASMIADLSGHGWDAAMIDGELAEQGWTQASYDRAIAALADLRDPGASKQPEPPAAEADDEDPFA